jgi:hypothetical protein
VHCQLVSSSQRRLSRTRIRPLYETFSIRSVRTSARLSPSESASPDRSQDRVRGPAWWFDFPCPIFDPGRWSPSNHGVSRAAGGGPKRNEYVSILHAGRAQFNRGRLDLSLGTGASRAGAPTDLCRAPRSGPGRCSSLVLYRQPLPVTFARSCDFSGGRLDGSELRSPAEQRALNAPENSDVNKCSRASILAG